MYLTFHNISDFSNIQDYIPIINGAIITDLIVIFLVIQKQIKSISLREWYNKYGLSGVLADVLSIVIGVLITRFIYPFIFNKFHLFLFICLAVFIQCIHDLLFAKLFYTIPKGKSQILDTFKRYADENGWQILLADALMMISTILLASLLSSFGQNSNLVMLIVVLYLIPYFLYSI